MDKPEEILELEDIANNDELDFGGVKEPEEEDDELDIELDVLEALSSVEQEELLENTEDVRRAIEKVSFEIANCS